MPGPAGPQPSQTCGLSPGSPTAPRPEQRPQLTLQLMASACSPHPHPQSDCQGCVTSGVGAGTTYGGLPAYPSLQGAQYGHQRGRKGSGAGPGTWGYAVGPWWTVTGAAGGELTRRSLGPPGGLGPTRSIQGWQGKVGAPPLHGSTGSLCDPANSSHCRPLPGLSCSTVPVAPRVPPEVTPMNFSDAPAPPLPSPQFRPQEATRCFLFPFFFFFFPVLSSQPQP